MKSSTVASLASATVTAFSLMTTNYSLKVDALCLKKIALKLHVGVTSSVTDIKVENLGDASETDSHSTDEDSETDSHSTDGESERGAPNFVPSQSRKSGGASIDAICEFISKRGADEREKVLLKASIRPSLGGKNFLNTTSARELAADKAEGETINKCLESLEEIKEHLSKKSKNKEIKEDSWVHWFSQMVEKCLPVPRHEGVDVLPVPRPEGDMALSNWNQLLEKAGVSKQARIV